MTRVAFYTATMSGAGHLSRALAVYNGLQRAGFRGAFRAFSPTLPFVGLQLPFDHTAAHLSEAEQQSATLARNSTLARAMLAFRPDLILVDVFWFPLQHILPMLRAEAWLLLRWVPPGWLHRPLRGAASDPAAPYRRLIQIEPVPHTPRTDLIAPVMVTNPDEQQPTDALKRRLGLPTDQPLTLVIQAGAPDEIDQLRAELQPRGEHVAELSIHRPPVLWPAAPWLRGADRIIGGVGYNLFWEIAWLGLRDRTTLRPFGRDMDDQRWRMTEFAAVTPRANGADQLARLILEG